MIIKFPISTTPLTTGLIVETAVFIPSTNGLITLLFIASIPVLIPSLIGLITLLFIGLMILN